MSRDKLFREIVPFGPVDLAPSNLGQYNVQPTGVSVSVAIHSPRALVIERIVVDTDGACPFILLWDVVYEMAKTSGKGKMSYDRCFEVCEPVEGSRTEWRLPGFPAAVSGNTLAATYPRECLPDLPALEANDVMTLSFRNIANMSVWLFGHLVAYRMPEGAIRE